MAEALGRLHFGLEHCCSRDQTKKASLFEKAQPFAEEAMQRPRSHVLERVR